MMRATIRRETGTNQGEPVRHEFDPEFQELRLAGLESPRVGIFQPGHILVMTPDEAFFPGGDRGTQGQPTARGSIAPHPARAQATHIPGQWMRLQMALDDPKTLTARTHNKTKKGADSGLDRGTAKRPAPNTQAAPMGAVVSFGGAVKFAVSGPPQLPQNNDAQYV